MGKQIWKTYKSPIPQLICRFMNPAKIAIIHPLLIAGGGSEAVALWAIEALKHEYDINLITMGNPDLLSLNECYHTSINEDQIKILRIPIPYLLKNSFDALKGYKLARYCKRKSSEFDLMISAYNVMDFGRKGIQYISDISFSDRLRRAFDSTDKGWKGFFYKESLLRRFYLKIGEVLAGTNRNGWMDNITISNSCWTSELMKKIYGKETKTIYPPVFSNFPNILWNERENGFVCIGRIVPEKRIEAIIESLKRVKKRGRDIHLHILGKADDPLYEKKLKQVYEGDHDWIFWEGQLFDSNKLKVIAQHKFGIHGHRSEAFGIAVAEMVKAGCIVWVPDDGGQVEIVNHPNLIYGSVEDAVNKIDRILNDQTIQTELREHLAGQAQKYSIERFMSEISETVHRLLEEKNMVHPIF